MAEIKDKYKRCCILLSGGVGSRMESDIPKQYVKVAGKSILEHTLLAISNWTAMDSLIVVANEKWRELIQTAVETAMPMEQVAYLGIVSPGENRQLSIRNALQRLRPYMAEDAIVMIHDAVRPCVSKELLERCDSALLEKRDATRESGDGVMPYLPMKDTVYISTADSRGGKRTITANIDRNTVVAGQTPEFYSYWKYLAATEALSEEEILKIHGSTEVAVAAGMKMILVPGDEGNFKITTREDLERFRRIKETH